MTGLWTGRSGEEPFREHSQRPSLAVLQGLLSLLSAPSLLDQDPHQCTALAACGSQHHT